MGCPWFLHAPFSTWAPVKPADFLVAEWVVDDISHEGLRIALREEGVSSFVSRRFQDSPCEDRWTV